MIFMDEDKRFEKYAAGVLQRICPQCRSGILEPHSDMKLAHQGWRKCPICAFCKKKDDEEVNNSVNPVNVPVPPKL